MQDRLIAGVDEVGRGPLIGPVVAAAVILPPEGIDGLKDSKKLTAKRREVLATFIREKSIAFALGEASPAEIDSLNIHQASLLAMQRAIEALRQKPAFIYVDGRFSPQVEIPCEAVIKGDDKVPAISAASILAKVARDQWMIEYAKKHPAYGFESHKGYPTARHLDALQSHGILPEHRRSYKPVQRCMT